MIFFTADEHYGHTNIIKYCNRPFTSVEQMNEELIRRHNGVVGKEDKVVHVGDFFWGKDATRILERLTGKHTFIRGSHDRHLPNESPTMLEFSTKGQHIVACHYAMRVWPRSHYGSWQVYGHSHGKLLPQRGQWDVGVDNNDFYPVSFDRLKELIVR